MWEVHCSGAQAAHRTFRKTQAVRAWRAGSWAPGYLTFDLSQLPSPGLCSGRRSEHVQNPSLLCASHLALPLQTATGWGGALLDWQPVPRAGAPNQAAACGGPGWLQLALCVPPDWESLQLGGMIFAGLLCIVGIAMALSEWRGAGLGAAGALALASGDLALPPPRWQMQTQARPRPQVRHRCPTVCTSCWGGGGSIGG